MNGLLTVAERHALGQDHRARLPRSGHANWSVPAARPDPVDTVLDAERGRIASLLPLRHQRMAPDPFAFLRGSAALMAGDLATQPDTGLLVTSCGDAHVGNFGAAASPDDAPTFDVIDFDEAYVAPFEWDLKRLAASLVVAGLARDMPDKAARGLARRAAQAYRHHIDALAAQSPLECWRSRIELDRAVEDIADRDVRRRERHRIAGAVEDSRRAYAHLVSRDGRLALPDRPPLIWRLGDQEGPAHEAYAAYVTGLPPERRVLLERYRLVDVAFKAVGVGSVGTFCALGLFATADDEVLLLQLKQAAASVLQPLVPTPKPPPHQGERVVHAQRMMQAAPDVFLGWTQSGEHQFYVRRLADARLSAVGQSLEAESLRFYAALCGRTLARAHARSGDAAMIAGYLGEGDSFDVAIAAFASAYAAQTRADHAAWCGAIRSGRVAT